MKKMMVGAAAFAVLMSGTASGAAPAAALPTPEQMTALRTMAATITPAQLGAWKLSVKHSELDGTDTATASLDSANSVPNSIGADEHAMLVIRCEGERGATYVAWPAFVGGQNASVRYKVDQGAVISDFWSVSDSGTAVGRFDNRSGKLMTDLIGVDGDGKKLVVSVTARGRTADEAIFDITGAKYVVLKMLVACDPTKPHA